MALARAALLVAVIVAAHAPALRSDFIWDDDSYVTANPALTAPDGWARIWTPGGTPQYYPLVFSMLRIERGLFGLGPMGYHAVNVALHALAAILLAHALARLRVPGAWAIAAIFAVHPIQVESVAWITERKNVLSAALFIAALASYMRFAAPVPTVGASGVSGASGASRRRWWWYAAAIILYTGALLSKTVAATMPVVAGLALLYRDGRVGFGRAVWLLPMLALGGAAAALTAHLEATHVKAAGEPFDFTLVERVEIAARAILFYPLKILWPRPLVFFYPRWGLGGWLALAAPLVVAAFSVLLAFVWRRGRGGRRGRGVVIALSCYAVIISPALGFVSFYPMRFAFVADHFAYLAMVGVVAAVVGPCALLVRRAWLRSALLAVVLALLVLLTWDRGRDFSDIETLWRRTLAKNPEAWGAHNNLGLIELRRGENERALERFDDACRLAPDFARARVNRGIALRRLGRIGDAREALRAAMEIDPGFVGAPYEMARLEMEVGAWTEAARMLRLALVIAPDHAPALRELVFILVRGPDPSVRDAVEGLAAARSFVRATGERDPEALLALSIALDANGDRAQGLLAAQQAAALARSIGNEAIETAAAAQVERLSGGAR